MWAEVMFVYFALTQGETEKDRGQLNEMYETRLDDRRQRGGPYANKPTEDNVNQQTQIRGQSFRLSLRTKILPLPLKRTERRAKN